MTKSDRDFAESYRTLPAEAQRVGDITPNEIIEVSIYLKPRQNAAPSAAANTTADARVALHARRATEHQEDIRLLTDFAAENGLTVTELNPGRRLVKMSGPASRLQAAFGTTLGLYQHGDKKFRGRSGTLKLPEKVLPVVEAVLGLDTRPAAVPHFVGAERAVSPEAIAGYLPNEVGSIYSFPKGPTGSGQCIGIIELGGGYNPTDNTEACGAMGLNPPTVVAVSVDGAQNAPGNDADGEVALDIQVAGGVAPGARIAVYFAPNTFQGFVDAVSAAAHDIVNKPSVISISWGSPEINWSAQALQVMNSALQDAAQVGVSVFSASGDHLGTDGETDGKAHVDFPASSPWAIGCGGTTLDVTGTHINSETMWNDGISGWGTGGGISDVFAVPAFQQGVNLPASVNDGQKRRGVPDVPGTLRRPAGPLSC